MIEKVSFVVSGICGRFFPAKKMLLFFEFIKKGKLCKIDEEEAVLCT